MDSEPVSYDSLKTVLQYMEANVRFKLSQHIPSICFAERSVPLKINNLSFGDMDMIVNKTRYGLGIYRKYHSVAETEEIQQENENGGVQNDLDPYGLVDWSTETIVTPGDVKIGRSSAQSSIVLIHQNDMEQLETEVRNLEEAIQHGDDYINMNGFEDSDEDEEEPEAMEDDEDDEEDQLDMELEDQEAINLNDNAPNIEQGINVMFDRNVHIRYRLPIAEAKIHLEELRKELVLYHCRRDKIPPPFDMFIQYTVISAKGKQIERVSYNRKLYEARKHLNSFLFGKRHHPIQVKCFKIGKEEDEIIFRLPLGLKFKIQQIKIPSNVVETYDALKPILDASSFPLKHLILNIVSFNHVVENIGHEIVRSAKSLVISSYDRAQWRTILPSISNRRVHLEFQNLKMNSCISLIQNWLDTVARLALISLSSFLKKKKLSLNF